RDVRHDAEGEDGQPAEVAANEDIHQPEYGPLALLEELLEQVGVDARRRNVPTQAEHRQDTHGEQNALAQFWNAENITDCFHNVPRLTFGKGLVYPSRNRFPRR